MDELARNLAQQRSTEIEQLIAAENDPDKRAHLIVISSINNSAIATAELAYSLYARLEKYEIRLQDHVQQGDRAYYFKKGVLYVMGGVLALAQVIFGWGMVRLTGQLDKLQTADAETTLQMATMALELKNLRNLKGETGATGDVGAVGKTGAVGRTGETGDVGPKGAPGKNFWGNK